MAESGGASIAIEVDGRARGLCRIVFEPDGSYSVAGPLHGLPGAVIATLTTNFSRSSQWISAAQAVHLPRLDDLGGPLRLTHGRDGLVQFRGAGLVSGREDDGSIRGVGVQAWPIDHPALGPAFVLTVAGIDQLEDPADRDRILVFPAENRGWNARGNLVILEGWIFPTEWRRFLRFDDRGAFLDVVHPAKAIVRLRAVPDPGDCSMPGFLAVDVHTEDGPASPAPRFALAGPVGNMHQDAAGEWLGAAVVLAYPQGYVPNRPGSSLVLAEAPPSYPQFGRF
jgi:hypothetical protein